jgi:ribose-phosphate pyrophosphokinase
MLYLNLINPNKTDIPFQHFTFPDGQPHLKIDVSKMPKNSKHVIASESVATEAVTIVSRIVNPSDLFTVLIAKDALESMGFESISLTIPYLMAARMDRQMTEGEPFSLRVLSAILNQANFKKITIFDPHSDVSTALLLRSKAIGNEAFVKDCIEDFTKNAENVIARNVAVIASNSVATEGGNENDYWLISPDAGALKKIHKVAQFVNAPRVAECMKMRDVKTGNLSSFKTMESNFEGRTCFIVDDICDGGGTFIGLAALLKSHNAGHIVLIVSHGIFSKGFDLAHIDAIYTTNSFKDFENLPNNVRCFAVSDYL